MHVIIIPRRESLLIVTVRRTCAGPLQGNDPILCQSNRALRHLARHFLLMSTLAPQSHSISARRVHLRSQRLSSVPSAVCRVATRNSEDPRARLSGQPAASEPVITRENGGVSNPKSI